MKIRLSVLLSSILLTATLSPCQAQTCSCGPTYCVDTPAYTKALAAKKKNLTTAGKPARLVSLFDKLDRCEASITTSPDDFRLLQRDTAGNIADILWTAQAEKDGAAAAVGPGAVCIVLISRRAFACCGGTPYDERADYNKALDLNMTATTPCAK